MKKRTLTLVISLLLVALVAVGGTLAWLMDGPKTVTNTFTAGDVVIDLTETVNPDGTTKATADPWVAQMIPGKTYSKNPTVSVNDKLTNVDCYLFVKFEANAAAVKYLDYSSMLEKDAEWIQLNDNVWYRIVEVDDETKSWNLLEDNKVTVDGTEVTKKTMGEAEDAELKYTAYAVQKDNLTVGQAWNVAQGLEPGEAE